MYKLALGKGVNFIVYISACTSAYRKTISVNADWKREAGWQAAQDLCKLRTVRRLKGGGAAPTGVCRRGD